MSISEPMLQIRHLTRIVGRTENSTTLVDDFSYRFDAGRIYTILGPSSAGKSSLLRLLNRLDEPTDGEVVFDGNDYRTYSPCELRGKIGYLFQVPHLFESSVEDNVRFASPELRETRVSELLDLVSVKPELRKRPGDSLSVGEKQRVALARLLATDPKVILLDEPTSSLDPTYTVLIETVIRQIVARQKVTAVMVSHEPQQALRMEGEGLLLVGGRLVEHGPIRDLVERPSTELGRQYQNRELT